MTVLQRTESTNEGKNVLPRKRIRLSACHNSPESARSIESWSANKKPVIGYSLKTPKPEMVNNHDAINSSIHIRKSPEVNEYGDNNCLPIGSLLNLGNTCFLNSVLYTLRFAPSFLHKLHHLNNDSAAFMRNIFTGKLNFIDKSHSLTRNFGRPNLWTTESNLVDDPPEAKGQIVIERLHHVYRSLADSEYKSSKIEPFQPNIFLHSLREVNPMFEGNQQHDAHELLVCLLDIIREACEVLYMQNSISEKSVPDTGSPSSNPLYKAIKSFKKSLKFKKVVRNERDIEANHKDDAILNEIIKEDLSESSEENDRQLNSANACSPNTIFDDFQGVSVLRTTCLECEQVTEMKETFCDICVPIQTIEEYDDIDAANKLYHSIIVTEELLADANKYWCDKCVRYNEAKRSVSFQKLPRLLTLHLKRFSSQFGSVVSKVNEHMPTPLVLYCFCEECCRVERLQDRPHFYELYAIIMHLGATIASGHYVSYVKTNDSNCFFDESSSSKSSTLSRASGTALGGFAALNEQQYKWFKLLKKNKSPFINAPSPSSHSNSTCSGESSNDKFESRDKVRCKASECCGVRFKNALSSSLGIDNEPIWLECDDECIRAINTQELIEMLAPKSLKGCTPYLLFYARNTY